MTSPRIGPAEGSDPAALNIFRTLQRAPELNAAFLTLGAHLLRGDTLPPREREIVILRTGFRARAEYEFAQHTRLGLAAGLTESEIAALAGAPGSWSAADAALIALVDELCADDAVTAETWALLAARWDEQELLGLLVLAGFYRLVSGMLNSVGVALEPGAPGWPEGVDLRRAPRA